MSEAKLDILDKIRHARGGNSDANEIAAALRAIGKPPAAPLDCDSVLETFLLRLAVNKIEVESVANRSEVVLSIAKFLYKEHNTHKVVAGNDRRLAALPWRDGGTLVRFDSAVAADPVSVRLCEVGGGREWLHGAV